MIDPLVEQIEARFSELERQMSDPEVIGDRSATRRSGASTASSRQPTTLAGEYRTLNDDLEGARELLAEDGDDAELRKVVEEAPARLERARRGDPPGDGRARSERRQERPRRDPGRHRRRRGGALRRRPLQDADPLRGGARLRHRGALAVAGRRRRLQGGHLRGQGRRRLLGLQVRGRHPSRPAGARRPSRRAASTPRRRRWPSCPRPRRSRSTSTRTISRSTSTGPPGRAGSR